MTHRNVLLAVPILLGTLLALLALAAPRADAEDTVRGPGFTVECFPVQRAYVDPIVSPGTRSAHEHDVFGPEGGITSTTTATQLLNQANNCEHSGLPDKDAKDHSAYWQPVAILDGRKIPVLDQVEYYNSPNNVDPRKVRPFPFGLKVVAGDAHATQPDTQAVVWRCAPGGGTGFARPQDCPRDTHVAAYVRFPDCWDGRRLDSFDHQSHMAYSNKKTGECPSTHPVHVPRLQMAMGWPTRNGSDIRFSSGPPETMHADFYNAWNRERLEFLVRECWNDGTGCKNRPPI